MTNEKPTNPSHGELLDEYADAVQPAFCRPKDAGDTSELRSLILGKMGEGEARNIQDNAYLAAKARLAAQPDVREALNKQFEWLADSWSKRGTLTLAHAEFALRELAAHLAPQAGVPQTNCEHCKLRVYLDRTDPLRPQGVWRHHASNFIECFGDHDTWAEPEIPAAPASHTPRCPKCGGSVTLRRPYSQDQPDVIVRVECVACAPTWWGIRSWGHLLEFFPVTSSQGGAEHVE